MDELAKDAAEALSRPFHPGPPDGLEALFHIEGTTGIRRPGITPAAPGLGFLRRRGKRFGVRHSLSHQHGEIAVHAEGVGGVQQLGARHHAGTILLIKADEKLGAVQLGVVAAGPPEGVVQPGIELVVHGQEIADVIPRPELLSALIEASAESDLVSLLPLMLLGTSAERLILPAFLELLAAIYPFKRVNRHSSPLAFAIGQCLMIRRGAYNAIDGHAAVRASVLEDMQLARQAKQAGLRLQVAEASDLLAVRMYLGWSSLTEGLAKNAVAGARHGGMRVALIATQRLVLGWLPMQILMLGWLTNEPLTTDAWLACGALLLLHMLVSGWIVLHRFRIHASWGVLLPLGTLIYFLIAAYGFIRIGLGIGVRWKGRVLETRD